MSTRDQYRFDLRRRIREIVLSLLNSPKQEATLFELSRNLGCDIGSLRMELTSQVQKYPAICFDQEKKAVVLRPNSIALFSVISEVFEELKRLFFVPKRFEGILYEIAARSGDGNAFWDKVQTLIWASDHLSGFLLRHFIGIAVQKFGSLGSVCFDDMMRRTTLLYVCDYGRYPNCGRPIEIQIANSELQNCLSFMKANPVFVREKTEGGTNLPNREMLVLMENSGIVFFNTKRQMYNLRLPLIYPWDLNCCVIRFLVTEDYCRRIYRESELWLENPLPAMAMLALIKNLLETEKKNDMTFQNITSLLKDFSYNVVSIVYRVNDETSIEFEMATSFPLSLEDPKNFGSILWALKNVPKVVELMPFEWFRTALIKAVETSRLLGVTIGIPDLSEDFTIFFTSPPVADAISEIADSFGMIPRTKYHEDAKMIRFSSRRDLKRIGILPQIGIAENQDDIPVEGFIFEILNEVLRIRPKITILLEDLADRLEVDTNFLEDFIKRYLGDSLDLSLPGEIAPLKDPWLELRG